MSRHADRRFAWGSCRGTLLLASLACALLIGCERTPDEGAQGGAATQPRETRLRLSDVRVDQSLAVAVPLPAPSSIVAPETSTTLHVYRAQQWSPIDVPGSTRVACFTPDGAALICVGPERIRRVDLLSQDIVELFRVEEGTLRPAGVTADRSKLMVHALTGSTGPDSEPSLTTLRIMLDLTRGEVLSEHDLGIVSLNLPPVYAGVNQFFVRENESLRVLPSGGSVPFEHRLTPEDEILAVDMSSVLWLSGDRRLMLNDQASIEIPSEARVLTTPWGRETLRIADTIHQKAWLAAHVVTAHVGGEALSWTGMDEDGHVFAVDVRGEVFRASEGTRKQVLDLRPLPGPLEPLQGRAIDR